MIHAPILPENSSAGVGFSYQEFIDSPIIQFMHRYLLLISILPIVAGLLLRWWFGLRVLVARGAPPARCDGPRWNAALGSLPALPAADPPPDAPTTNQLGRELREIAIRQWREREPRAARARESTRRFGLAVPPLAAMVAAMGVIAARMPVMWALAAFAAATALATVFGLLSLGAELRAIAVTARTLREARAFRRADDEEAVIECAVAHAWDQTVPPVLRLFK